MCYPKEFIPEIPLKEEIETKARDLIITDFRNVLELRRYLRKEDGPIIRAAKALWKKQSALVTQKTMELAIQAGTAPSELATPMERMIREFVRDDITPQWVKSISIAEALAVARFMAALAEEGVPAAMISTQGAKYANFLHKNRAMRIARTELSNAYNFGQQHSLLKAADEGWLPGEPEKSWMAGGADPCEICLENESVGYIGLQAAFPSGDEHPTAHPHCECAVGYKVRR